MQSLNGPWKLQVDTAESMVFVFCRMAQDPGLRAQGSRLRSQDSEVSCISESMFEAKVER